jgi:PKD repeat protein
LDQRIERRCGIASLVVTPNTFTCADVGTNTVTLTVTDVNSNSTCTAQVTVEDTVPPIALCQDITVQLDATGNGSVTPLTWTMARAMPVALPA